MKFRTGLSKWSVFYLYCLWNVVLAIHAFLVVGLGGQENAQRNGALSHLIELYVAVAVSIFILGALLSWLAIYKGYMWSSWAFIIFCAWRAIDLLWGGYELADDGSRFYANDGEWIRIIFFALVWVYLIIKERARIRKSVVTNL